jgi:hypothetical protein
MISGPQYLPERRVLEEWAKGFIDRDGKFVNEFQTTFESSMWELYLNAYLRELGATLNFSHHAPDFVVDGPAKFCERPRSPRRPRAGRLPLDTTRSATSRKILARSTPKRPFASPTASHPN